MTAHPYPLKTENGMEDLYPFKVSLCYIFRYMIPIENRNIICMYLAIHVSIIDYMLYNMILDKIMIYTYILYL
jgi:hypothetical protein